MSTKAPSTWPAEGTEVRQPRIMSGNEAIARGAWEAGVRFASAYPGTPSTEILEALSLYEGLYAEWSPNEKVAVEAATGASLAGVRALACMKHVGLNVAADPLFSASYIGVRGGLVVVTADDPAMHSSQDEQDNRHYARFAKIPLVEPADAEEARTFVGAAFDLSERFDTPVLLRTTTRTSHSQGVVQFGERLEGPAAPTELTRDTAKYLMLPQNARAKHPQIEGRIRDLAGWAETCDLNRIEMGDESIGIITSGAAYGYVCEAFPGASVLKLGLTYPLPRRLIAEFRARVDRLFVVEELDPFLQDLIELQGIIVDGGRDVLPRCGEYDPGVVARGLTAAGVRGARQELLQTPEPVALDLPARPPTMCPGCSHRGVFVALRKMRAYVCGDIGCYSLGALPPFEAMHCSTCMGAGISMAHGMAKALDPEADDYSRPVAVIGDSTFFHSGMTSLLDIAFNGSDVLTVILDNRTTAMTGGQENPGMGKTLSGALAPDIDISALVRAFGITRVSEIDPFDLEHTERVLREELRAREPSVVIARSPCVLQYKIRKPAWRVEHGLCSGCKVCLKAGCTALSLCDIDDGSRKVEIDPAACGGCGVCAQLCRAGAITGPPGAAAERAAGNVAQ
jgi:indolepyruvate ferredoxin oxidoreductase alpha subunit